MNIKSLLLGSAAALAAVSGAQAADAIVAAEPEPMEYVRVCDAFGTGYFYIPGTETCLKIGGYVRFQVDGRSDSDFAGDGYRTNTRGQIRLEAKSDTEFGTLGSRITIRGNTNSDRDVYLEDTYIELGGFRVGQFYNYFDNGLPGETVLSDGGPTGSGMGYFAGDTLNNGIRYTYEGAAFTAYAGVEFFDSEAGWKTDDAGNADEIGINGLIAGKFGAVSIDLFGGYDFDTEEGVVASTLTAELGPGELGIFAAYATGVNRYYDFSEWTIGAEYAFKVSDKFKIAPGAQYWDNIGLDADGDLDGGDAWRAGVTLDYAITTNLAAKATVNYNDVDYGRGGASDEYFDGFLRLQRSF